MAKLPDKLKAAQTIEIKQRAPGVEGLKTAPSMFLADQNRLYDAEKKLEKALQKKIALSDLHEVKGRRRALTSEAYAELKANLENNPLISPITVVARKQGGYEVVAGHNRLAVYRELGRADIEAIVLDFPDEEVEDLAFYSNLVNSELSDYEKFVGFKAIQERTSQSQAQIAQKAGVTPAMISYIMSFSDLPADALNKLKNYPHAIGATAVAKLKGAKPELINLAVEKLISGELTESGAVAFVQQKAIEVKVEKFEKTIKSGNKNYAKITLKNNLFAVNFKDEKEAKELLKVFSEILEERAKKAK